MVVTHLVTRFAFSQNNINYFSLLRFSLINVGAGAPAAYWEPVSLSLPEIVAGVAIDNAYHVHEFGRQSTQVWWMPVHMDDNPVTIEGNNREVIEGGGLVSGLKEDFNVHNKLQKQKRKNN